MTSEEQFDSLLLAAQAGAEWAFAELYGRYNAPLLRYFASRAPRAAEDLAAETWMGVARALADFRGPEPKFRSWLFTIAHHRLADHWADRSAPAGEPADQETLAEYLAPDETEGSVVESLSGREAVRKIASALPADQAEIVLLRVLAGLGVEEVAEIVGRRPGTVRVLQHRALKKLAKEFSPEPVTE